MLLNARIGAGYVFFSVTAGSQRVPTRLYTFENSSVQRSCTRFPLPPSPALLGIAVPRVVCRLKASFTVTVLETRTDQNSFFMGRALSRERWIILSRVPRRQRRSWFPNFAAMVRRNRGNRLT